MGSDQHFRIRQTLREFISRNFLYMQREVSFSDDDSLLRTGIIDSLGVLELVDFVEEQWNVPVDLQGITEATFGSVSAIARYIAGAILSAQPDRGAA